MTDYPPLVKGSCIVDIEDRYHHVFVIFSKESNADGVCRHVFPLKENLDLLRWTASGEWRDELERRDTEYHLVLAEITKRLRKKGTYPEPPVPYVGFDSPEALEAKALVTEARDNVKAWDSLKGAGE